MSTERQRCLYYAVLLLLALIIAIGIAWAPAPSDRLHEPPHRPWASVYKQTQVASLVVARRWQLLQTQKCPHRTVKCDGGIQSQ